METFLIRFYLRLYLINFLSFIIHHETFLTFDRIDVLIFRFLRLLLRNSRDFVQSFSLPNILLLLYHLFQSNRC
jgi:hypothetical protein